MTRRIAMLTGFIGGMILLAAWATAYFSASATTAPLPSTEKQSEEEAPAAAVDIGAPLYKSVAVAAAPVPERKRKANVDPIVIGDCRVVVLEKAEVASRKDGILRFVGTEIKEGEHVPADQLIEIQIGADKKKFRRLKEGDLVEKDQLLAMLDDELARAECAIKKGKIVQAKLDSSSAEKTREEARQRLLTAERLFSQGRRMESEEKVREAKLAYARYGIEAESKLEAIKLAELELEQAAINLKGHEIRSGVKGIIKTIYKQPSEAVKGAPAYEPVFQIRGIDRLRAEGLVEEQYVPYSPLEASRAYVLRQLVTDDRSPPTCAAFAPDGSFLVTGARDRNVLIWPVPTQLESARHMTATITNIEKDVDPSSRQVRIWAELEDTKGLLPGASVTMVYYPQ